MSEDVQAGIPGQKKGDEMRDALIYNTTKRILQFIYEREYVSFIELEKWIERNTDIDAKGDAMVTALPNLILWYGMGEDLGFIIRQLLADKEIYIHPSTVLVYSLDGARPSMKVAKRFQNYVTPRWFPSTLCMFPVSEIPPTTRQYIKVSRRWRQDNLNGG